MRTKKRVTGYKIATGESKVFNSIREAESRTGANYRHILDILKGRRKTSNGWVFTEYGAPKPDLNTISKRKPRVKKSVDVAGSWWGNNYYFTNDRGLYDEKCARYDNRGILQVSYNFNAEIIDGMNPDLEAMTDFVKRRVEGVYGRCIYILTGNVSRARKTKELKYYINAELTIKMPTKPTEKQLKNLEKLITDVRY